MKYLGHNRFQLSTPPNYSSSVAAMRMFLLFFLLTKVLARNCTIKSKRMFSNICIIFLMLVCNVYDSGHWHWVRKCSAIKREMSTHHNPSPRSDLDAATLIWRVMEFNCTDMDYVMLVNLSAWLTSSKFYLLVQMWPPWPSDVVICLVDL